MTEDAMAGRTVGTEDYPLAERRPDLLRTAGGKTLDSLTLDAVLAGEVTLADLGITPDALRLQGAIARDAGRATLARNLERAADLVAVPQEVLLEIYELLRPGRAGGKQALLDAAHRLRREYGSDRMARFVEEAAEVYERRGLFKARY